MYGSVFCSSIYAGNFCSMFISFAAIFQILTNEFNGPKGMWILISMIGFIGPILWLTKGRKLIIKK